MMTAIDCRGVERTLWLFEQLGDVPHPTRFEQPRHQVALAATHYVDSLSSQIGGNLDLGLIEIAGLYSRRTFLEVGERGRSTRSSLSGLEQSFLIEMARYFSTAGQHYGRISVGYFKFPDANYDGLRVSLSTGVMSTEQVPWQLMLRFAAFVPLQSPTKRFTFEADCARVWSSLAAGGSLLWSYVPREELGLGRWENMLLSFGPYVDIALGPSRLRAAVRSRLWLDKELYAKSATENSIANPSEFIGFPDASLTWTFLF